MNLPLIEGLWYCGRIFTCQFFSQFLFSGRKRCISLCMLFCFKPAKPPWVLSVPLCMQCSANRHVWFLMHPKHLCPFLTACNVLSLYSPHFLTKALHIARMKCCLHEAYSCYLNVMLNSWLMCITQKTKSISLEKMWEWTTWLELLWQLRCLWIRDSITSKKWLQIGRSPQEHALPAALVKPL